MDQTLLLKAVNFAAKKHSKQRRKGEHQDPYINHPVEVALLIAEVGGVTDAEVLAAAILHDTIEDTDTTAEEIEKNFGGRILSLVREVTDDKSLPKEERKKLQVEHAASLSPEAVMIKIADKISNVGDVTHSPPRGWNRQRRKDYLAWAESVVVNCKNKNGALEARFRDMLAEGRRILGV
ncbi:MAG: HD domain-containing protein [Spirochaetales bacterium]|nr:MAG: HD domain-containing protein [Spirochaetales bacterium]